MAEVAVVAETMGALKRASKSSRAPRPSTACSARPRPCPGRDRPRRGRRCRWPSSRWRLMPPLRSMSSMDFSMAATTRSGPPLPRGGAFFAADDLARLTHQRGLHFGAADVHAQIEPPPGRHFASSWNHPACLYRGKPLNTVPCPRLPWACRRCGNPPHAHGERGHGTRYSSLPYPGGRGLARRIALTCPPRASKWGDVAGGKRPVRN